MTRKLFIDPLPLYRKLVNIDDFFNFFLHDHQSFKHIYEIIEVPIYSEKYIKIQINNSKDS